MTLERILDIAKRYNELGWAIQEQLDDVVQGDVDKCNPNALKACQRFLAKVREHAKCNGDDELESEMDACIDGMKGR